ncbi:ABC transporter ATP-binding protein [Coprothermobacteraceae bacterium]|nr:ABC transporter ATP-binding protein [Coprothermobacteraceae bacterium]
MNPTPLIELEMATKVYGSGESAFVALRGVNLQIHRGEFVAITGRSGSGKSTLMHILGCLDTLTSGIYRLEGVDVAQLSDDHLAGIRNRRIGFVFQAFNLLPHLNVLEQVMVPLHYAGIFGEKAREMAMAALQQVGLDHKWNRKVTQISGGEMQRVAIARAIVLEPDLLLADEPTGNLDTTTSEEVLAIFDKLNAEGSTIVLVTHEHDVAAHAKRVIHLRDGQVESEVLNP